LKKGSPDAGCPYDLCCLHGGGSALIGRWAAAGITVVAIAAAVLTASTLAVMFGLS